MTPEETIARIEQMMETGEHEDSPDFRWLIEEFRAHRQVLELARSRLHGDDAWYGLWKQIDDVLDR